MAELAEFGRSWKYYASNTKHAAFSTSRLHICHIYEQRRKTILFAGTHNSLSILLITVDSCCAFPRPHRQIDMFPPFFVSILVRGRVCITPGEAENRLLHGPEELCCLLNGASTAKTCNTPVSCGWTPLGLVLWIAWDCLLDASQNFIRHGFFANMVGILSMGVWNVHIGFGCNKFLKCCNIATCSCTKQWSCTLH